MIAVVLGSIIYRFILLIVLALGFNPDDLKLISAIILAIVIMVPTLEHKFRLKKTLLKGVKNDD